MDPLGKYGGVRWAYSHWSSGEQIKKERIGSGGEGSGYVFRIFKKKSSVRQRLRRQNNRKKAQIKKPKKQTLGVNEGGGKKGGTKTLVCFRNKQFV